jgi:hypothetical protein
MKHFYLFPVGDWSGDGHAFVAEYLIKGDLSLDDVRKTHLSNNWIGDICREYQDNKIYSQGFFDFMEQPDDGLKFLNNLINTHNLNVDMNDEDGVNDLEVELTYQSLIELWVFILNKLNPLLNLEIVSEAMSQYYIKYKGYPVEKELIEGSISSYGFNDQNEHLNTPGYGVWTCDEEEFYLNCN